LDYGTGQGYQELGLQIEIIFFGVLNWRPPI
jgi:hypothetical protein